MTNYKPTIGIEVHAELNTKSKMFCGCANDPHHAEPNTNICPVCMAHPGTLPVVNKEAVRKVLQVGVAINGEIADFSEFDRKQYFYPDIPKAYQLSQYAFPFVKGGELAGVAITRVHLEEDTAKSQHTTNANDTGANASSQVDFNRAGVPLMELVTEPVIHDAASAVRFCKELQLLLRTIGVSDANMEKGEMRVEANISVSATDQLGTKVEVKNLNSFKVMELAIEYEISRQSEMLAKNKPIYQETRGWDESKGKTFVQRSKETAEDYRYFPDPDIPKYKLSELTEFNKTAISEKMPKIPSEMRHELSRLDLPADQIEILIGEEKLYNFFQDTLAADQNSDKKRELAKLAANYITSDIVSLLANRSRKELHSTHAIGFAQLMRLVLEEQLGSRVAKDLLEEVLFDGIDPLKTAEERGILQKNSSEELEAVVHQIIASNQAVVAEYQGGKESSLQYLIGQGMKLTKGSANPAKLAELLKAALSR